MLHRSVVMPWRRLLRMSAARTFYWVFGASAFLFLASNILLMSPSQEDLTLEYNLEVPLQLRKNWDLSAREKIVGTMEHRFRRLMEITKDNMHQYLSLSTVPSVIPTMLDCSDIRLISNRTYLASGWTKAVYKGYFNQKSVAIKVVDTVGHDMVACINSGLYNNSQCYAKSAQKIIKEILLLQGLAHDNVIKVMGFCVPSKTYNGQDDTIVTMVTELGDSVDIIKLLQMSWEDRLRVSLGITRLVEYLAHSPYGTLAMNDFRRQQFVLVDGELKMTDVDDMGFGEPTCSSDNDCNIYFSSANFTLKTSCIMRRCGGFNEKKNIFNAARHFTTFLLPHGAPRLLSPVIRDVVNSFSNVTTDATTLLKKLERIVMMYKTGKHLNRTRGLPLNTGYLPVKESDYPGQFDYRCRYSLSGNGCTVSVFDLREAEDICNMDTDCKGFIQSPQKTWTGRMIVHLKNGVGKPSKNTAMTLYLKPSGPSVRGS